MKGIDVGNQCNNNCIMCTQIRPSFSNAEARQKMHSKKDLLKQIKEARNEPAIVFTGGEPTMRQDIFELIEAVKSAFPMKRICMLTNGRMLAYKGYGKELEKIGLNEIIIPLHGHNAALHDFISQTEGSFAQTVQGIKNIRKSRMTTELRVVVHRLNYVYLPHIASFIAKQMPFVDRIVFLYFDAIGSGALNRERLAVSFKQVVPFLAKAFDRLGRTREKARLYHFPQCILPKSLRKAVYGRTVEMTRIFFKPECRECTYFSKCPGIWKTYKRNIGLQEFNAVVSE